MARLVSDHVIGRAPGQVDYRETGAHFRLAELSGSILPERVRDALAGLREGGHDAVVVHGLPADPLDDHQQPDGSHDGRDGIDGGAEATPQPLLGWTWLGMVTRQLGHEYGYRAEKGGNLVHDVRPRPDGAATQSNASSEVDLQLHTEVAFHEIRPDFVLLYGVRSPQPRPATRLVRIADAVRECSPETVRRLREPRFTIAAPDSFSVGEEAVDGIRPIGGTPGWPTIRWHSSIAGDDPSDKAAITEFRAAAERVAHRVRLAPGSLLAFSNSRCLHGRDAFEAHYDGRDRWLLRTYVLRDITRLMSRYGPPPGNGAVRRLAETRTA
ncbi:L-asparagine oxygenase [Micromonospora citrea]|uniref:L-asparagine oxygenase n=2 Tax=Micromonospora citrea TaxID=47855 RepID=A0A1C6TS65_9ACTN|nr:L-asparagine oxygenase [Micromonospora citrea]